ncbi:F-box/FBD/LRR-repeat protein At5g53840-like [Carica papaya]|uniref:F-box/FBD/LRR-repeat protein At5g53840-like n=1 Tax=Carica papaya TaxID=3649 RepID=UPI000B8CA921|nr:F-box/FBD/LRR-repeat protein At5g53840-like [Carica papaya]
MPLTNTNPSMLNSHRIGMCAAEKTGVDRISELPDNVLRRILCRLPLNEAARTTVLGDAWRSSWISFLISDFDDELFPDRDSYTDPFVPFVNEHLQRLCNQQRLSLQRFKLCVKNYHLHLPDYLDHWIKLAAAHNVKHLHLNRPRYNRFSVFPPSIYAQSLQVLELCGGRLSEPEGYSIDSLKFPSLKQLHFREIQSSENLLMSLINSCPLLEQLSIISCSDLFSLRLCGLAKLKSLDLARGCIQSLHIDQAENLESFVYSVDYYGIPCRVKITGCRKLKLLKLENIKVTRQWLTLLSDFPSLESLQIRLCYIDGRFKIPNPHLKHLELSTPFLCICHPVLDDSISLNSFTYRGHIKPHCLQNINTSTVQIAKFVLMYNHLHTHEFFQLRQFLSAFSQAKILKLHINSFHKVEFQIRELKEKQNFQDKILKHVRLTVKDFTRSESYKDFVDGLIWAIRVQILSIKILPRDNFDFIRSIQLIEVLCKRLISITKGLCCASSHSRCWRHYFKSVKVVWSENQSCDCERLLELLPEFPLHDLHSISFKFKY